MAFYICCAVVHFLFSVTVVVVYFYYYKIGHTADIFKSFVVIKQLWQKLQNTYLLNQYFTSRDGHINLFLYVMINDNYTLYK